MNWLCRHWGHAWDPDGARYYCVYHCTRCGYEGYESTRAERVAVRWITLKGHVRDWLRYYRPWRRCADCGRRWGRHDEAADHIPF